MARPDSAKSVDDALAHVSHGRRGFLKGLLLGSAALAALPLLKSEALAQEGGAPPSDDAKAKKGKKGKGKKGDSGGSGSSTAPAQ
jgi:hypothetical protein